MVYYIDEATGEYYVTGLSMNAQALIGIKSSSVANQKLSEVIEPKNYNGIDLIRVKVLSQIGVTELRGQWVENSFGGVIRLFNLDFWGSLNSISSTAENEILPSLKSLGRSFLGFQSLVMGLFLAVGIFFGYVQKDDPKPEGLSERVLLQRIKELEEQNQKILERIEDH